MPVNRQGLILFVIEVLFGEYGVYHTTTNTKKSCRPDSHMGIRDSGQIPIIILCLTHQEFLGMLIGLVTCESLACETITGQTLTVEREFGYMIIRLLCSCTYKQ